MLKPRVLLHQSQSLFLHGSTGRSTSAAASFAVWPTLPTVPSFPNKHKTLRFSSNPRHKTKALSDDDITSSSISTTSNSTTSGTPAGPTTTKTVTTTTEVTEVVTENEDAVVEKEVEVVTTKAVMTEKFISVKATITVTLTVGGFLNSVGLTRGLDDIRDMLGQTLFLDLVSAHVDPSPQSPHADIVVPYDKT